MLVDLLGDTFQQFGFALIELGNYVVAGSLGSRVDGVFDLNLQFTLDPHIRFDHLLQGRGYVGRVRRVGRRPGDSGR